ncbi:FliI/YscN family ATPase [Salmonella enterica]|nr:FliI/YscN family ATPase [Salmonella enterica]EKF0976925.1 type III secretion system ATPase SctN [Salmonella enterica]EKS5988129.1 type III secretion system ATPase SctN [Salmonella enterica]
MISRPFIHVAHPLRIQGGVIEANLPETYIGEVCKIQRSLTNSEIIGLAQVIGFNRQCTQLSLLSDNRGLSRNILLVPTGQPFKININDNIAGSILDSEGKVCGRLTGDDSERFKHFSSKEFAINGIPKDFTQRRSVSTPLDTGIRTIDALLTCGRGQRVGVFASAGCGKTSLMHMLIEHAEADIFVIGIIGERSREVTEFVDTLKKSTHKDRVVLVYSTSDRSCVERYNAAHIATAVAEYFSERGKNVLLFMDSITRYARALRDIALSMGEVPARKGYPASVFEDLPKLLERPGNFLKGSVTAFYTVLLENEDEPDAIGDEVKSILDGHIYLSQRLASKGHFPAIDVLKSTSRVFQQVTELKQQEAASAFRELLSRQSELQLYIDLGEYKRGENKQNDIALDKQKDMEDFMRQPMSEMTKISTCLNMLYEVVA